MLTWLPTPALRHLQNLYKLQHFTLLYNIENMQTQTLSLSLRVGTFSKRQKLWRHRTSKVSQSESKDKRKRKWILELVGRVSKEKREKPRKLKMAICMQWIASIAHLFPIIIKYTTHRFVTVFVSFTFYLPFLTFFHPWYPGRKRANTCRAWWSAPKIDLFTPDKMELWMSFKSQMFVESKQSQQSNGPRTGGNRS